MTEPVFEPGIAAYLRRIQAECGDLPAPRSIEERRFQTEQRHSVWKRPAPETVTGFDWWVGLPGREIGVRVQRRRDAKGVLPVVLYLHGGGFVASSYVTHDAITWGLAEGTGALVVSANYRRAPENPFPAAPEDCFGVLGWIIRNAALLGADARRIAVAGDSAGGCLATVLAMTARDRGGPELRLQALLYPCVDTDFARPSYRRDADPMLPAAAMRFFWQQYLQDDLSTDDPLAVPMRAGWLTGLPPAYLAVGEHDPLRDETEEYAQRLAEAGVPTECRVFMGAGHGFLRARFVSEPARAEFEALCSALRAALA